MTKKRYFVTKIKVILLAMSILSLLASCKKNSFGCLQPPGKTITKTIPLQPFRALLLTADIESVVFHKINFPDSARMELNGGENLIELFEYSYDTSYQHIPQTQFIDPETNDTIIFPAKDYKYNRLIIPNESTCKGIKRIDLYIDTLKNIEYRSNSNLFFKEPIESDTFVINVYEGAGKIHLWLENCSWSALNFHYGTAELNAFGNSKINYIYQSSFGPVKAQDLKTDFSYLENRSDNHCWARAARGLEAKINGNGNVYYYGPPDIASRSGTGRGELKWLGN